MLARARLANERRQSASEAARAREIQALEAAAAAQIERQKDEVERQKDEAAKEREKIMRLMDRDRVDEIAEVKSRHREATAKLEEKLAAAEAAGIAMLVKHAEEKKTGKGHFGIEDINTN